MTDPTVLPRPSPSRNAARISENVYVVAPSNNDNRRVHTASAARAVAPDSPIATYTGQAPAGTIEPDLRSIGGLVIRAGIGGRASERDADPRDDHVDRHGDVRRHGHVVNAQEIEAGEHAAEHRAGDVAAVEEAQPGNAFGSRLHPTGDRRERRAHEKRRRQQAERAEEAADQQIRRAVQRDREVQTAGVRQSPQHEQSEAGDRQLQQRVNAERVLAARHEAGEVEATDAHAAHERAEQHPERHRRRSDDETQELEPDDLVNQRRAAASNEKEDDQWEQPTGDR